MKLKFKDNPGLIMGRMRAIQALEELIVLWEREHRPAHKQFKAELIDDACGTSVEYTAVLRAYATYRGYPVSA
ncbi:hypothetical protein [Curtobacterium sp. NPDC092190]|uniref:hypothetical protein n=1 Tax=Curtobacterium sp. NPDC092190 TaxID=3363973 RepID=UPI00381986C4